MKGIGTGKGQVDLGVLNSLFEGASSKMDVRTERAVGHDGNIAHQMPSPVLRRLRHAEEPVDHTRK